MRIIPASVSQGEFSTAQSSSNTPLSFTEEGDRLCTRQEIHESSRTSPLVSVPGPWLGAAEPNQAAGARNFGKKTKSWLCITITTAFNGGMAPSLG